MNDDPFRRTDGDAGERELRSDISGRRGTFPLRSCQTARTFKSHVVGQADVVVRAVQLHQAFRIYHEHGPQACEPGDWIVEGPDGSARGYRESSFRAFFTEELV